MRDQHYFAGVERAADGEGVDLAHGSRIKEVDALAHADGARGDEVARVDADLRARHRRARQPLREHGLDLDAQHARRLLDRHERGVVGDAQALRVARAHAACLELGFDLRPRAVHQHEPDAERRQQVEVVHEG